VPLPGWLLIDIVAWCSSARDFTSGMPRALAQQRVGQVEHRAGQRIVGDDVQPGVEHAQALGHVVEDDLKARDRFRGGASRAPALGLALGGTDERGEALPIDRAVRGGRLADLAFKQRVTRLCHRRRACMVFAIDSRWRRALRLGPAAKSGPGVTPVSGFGTRHARTLRQPVCKRGSLSRLTLCNG